MRIIKTLLRISIYFFFKLWSFLYTYKLSQKWNEIKNMLYTAWLSREFKSIGRQAIIKYSIKLIGGKYISIGANTVIGQRTVLTAWDNVNSLKFQPEISIGENTNIGDDSHITSINKISIGNHVLTGKKITITDNAHGKSDFELLLIPPNKRPLFSKGVVIIEDNVWIGEKATILPGVKIGKNAIIGANSIVTTNIPANSVAAGIPARTIKTMQQNL